MPTTWTDAEYQALKAAIATGAKTVSYADRTVTYHSLDDMLKLLAKMEADMGGSTEGRSTLASPRRE